MIKISQRLQGYLIATVILLGITYALLFHVTDEARKGCERLNAVRGVEYRVLSGAEKSLQQQADAASTPQQQTILKSRAKEYSQYLELLLSTSAEFAPDQTKPYVDCSRAYQYPWPF